MKEYQFSQKPGMKSCCLAQSELMSGDLYYVDKNLHATSLQDEKSLIVERGKTLKDIDCRFAPFKKGIWKHYTPADGLAGISVQTIYQDSDGTMWFGTGWGPLSMGSGVSRFDGNQFLTFTTENGLVNNNVQAIYRDSAGMMWFGTIGCLSRWDGKEFKHFTTKDGLAHNDVYAIHETPDGILWFGTAGGVSCYDGKEFVNFTVKDGLAHNKVQAIHHDPNGVLWFGTGALWEEEGGGVSCYDGKRFPPLEKGDKGGFINFTTEDGLAGNWVRAIYQDQDGILWFGTENGVSRYDGEKFINLTPEDGLAGNRVTAIHSTPDGILWFGTDGGASRYDGERFFNFTTKDGLLDDKIADIYCAADGTLWFATQSGVSQYDEQAFITLTTDDGLAHNSVGASYRDPDGILWIGTEGGLSRYDGKEVINFTTKDGLTPKCITTIHQDPDGTLWFGTGGGYGIHCDGVFRYDGEKFVNFTTKDGLASNQVYTIYRDSDGALWFGTGEGASRYDGEKFLNFTTEDGLPYSHVLSIYRNLDGMMWFGTGWGLSRYDGNQFVNFTTEDGLPGNPIIAIHGTHDGTLWLGTWNGLCLYDGNQFLKFTLSLATSATDGLAGNLVMRIYHAADGLMWFGTSGNGVAGYDGTTWTSLDTRDGLANNGVWSIDSDPDGTLRFGTRNGLTFYRRSKTKPKARIVSVKTDRDYTVDVYKGLSGQAIPPITTGDRVTIEYSSIDFKTIPEKRQYRTRIYESENGRIGQLCTSIPYNPPTKKTSFDWIPEKPGTYTFEVQAIDRDLNYSKPAGVTLNVVLPSLLEELRQTREELEAAYRKLEAKNEELRRESERLKKEIEHARDIQKSILPEKEPKIAGFEIEGFSYSVLVGGDFYDYIQAENSDNFLIVVGDAAGHGLPAAMYAQSTCRLLKEIITKQNISRPDEILSRLNNIFVLSSSASMQVTISMYLAYLDATKRKLRLSRAGDCRAYCITNECVEEIYKKEIRGNSLGEWPPSESLYKIGEYDLAAEDLILICSDGLIDIVGGNQAEVFNFLRRIKTSSAKAAIESIKRSVFLTGHGQEEDNFLTPFIKGNEKADDITVVCIKVLDKQEENAV